MSEVLSIRVPRELKKRLEALKDTVDWRSEIVRFLEERVEYYERLKAIREIEEMMKNHPELPRGFAARSVREDRDSS
ncbi:CopG family transcriptional regulator [Pyrodictium abyssi]|uniref:type II toxin-antitoxin system VapB family antitoxin n=1 Tax=Pyrodictium abyssi TaxID=54256 RepID=UPI0030C71707